MVLLSTEGRQRVRRSSSSICLVTLRYTQVIKMQTMFVKKCLFRIIQLFHSWCSADNILASCYTGYVTCGGGIEDSASACACRLLVCYVITLKKMQHTNIVEAHQEVAPSRLHLQIKLLSDNFTFADSIVFYSVMFMCMQAILTTYLICYVWNYTCT